MVMAQTVNHGKTTAGDGRPLSYVGRMMRSVRASSATDVSRVAA
jgi:hypothetical protein